ncbi:KGGVGR-motif variant AAA ATPase [Bradyrhizobium sp. USDA 4451]
MTERQAGQIITFYSYKGGTGRTMALANLACLLAGEDVQVAAPRVLAIDWDFEAPGLHRYFHRYLEPDSAKRFDTAQGCLELFELFDREQANYDPEDFVANRQRAKTWFGHQDFTEFLLDTTFPGLHLMKAGLFDITYPRRVSEFRWDDLFHATMGMFSGFVDFLRSRFDYVLIDSRTGITDTSGICTTLLPDKLVVVFTPNQQSLTGIENLVAEAVTYRNRSPDGRPLKIFPLPSRIELAQEQLFKAWRRGINNADPSIAMLLPPDLRGYQIVFEQLFEGLYPNTKVDLESYFTEVLLQHIPDYAYGEPIAVALAINDTRISLARSYLAFRDRLIELDFPWHSLGAVRKEREIVRLCDSVTRELMERSVDEAIRLSRSLIERKPSEELFDGWTKAILDAAGAARQKNRDAALDLIRGWSQSAIFSDSDIDPSMLGEALLDAGKLCQELGELAMSKSLLTASIARLSDGYGEDHPATLAALDQLASVAFAGADFAEAKLLYESVLHVRRTKFGDDNPATLETLNNLAIVLFERGDIATSKDLLQQALARYHQMPGVRWRAIRELTSDTLAYIETRELGEARARLGQLQAEFRRKDQQGSAVESATRPMGIEGSKEADRRKLSTEPIATVDIVRPADLIESVDQGSLYLAPGYGSVDKMAAQPIAVGDKRIDFVAIQACSLDGVTLIWQSSQGSGIVWASFAGDAVEISRGETLRLYLNWVGW